jgi:hypothetical protein
VKTYVITFSTVGIGNGWIEVTANGEDIARKWADGEYVRWSCIYDPEDWTDEVAAFFPLGCLGRTTLHYELADHLPESRWERTTQ